MKKLEINKIGKYEYELKDSDHKIYHFSMEFYDTEKQPKTGDFIFMSEKLLRDDYAVLNFGSLGSKYGRNIETADDDDLIVLLVDDEKIYLKRVYG